ncbi:ABC transporter ATP-binding protein [Wenxinia marina]|uniref:ABC-type nitrate/sulfonate/bicarbonate transport system, ATPase component n=1 Tax=Wenxinia marina DSM 24838 TaxID=1123501 RepID=A0A0D0NGG9_9RHOB|nr:ABC transporter ATP-binding protein [Wenxinia marina]KIQ67425.1 ABC-type nitrate/sulfonate/bicarbonate transport system, ATPase component [Wenxinia marina DSM 24838]GGL69573.1 nitrate/sulfonate/bicarbonate ABC transporter ATP-binding protein [Wenxinia marina]
MTNLIEIKDVRHAYRTKAGPLPVLDGVDMGVPEGTFAAVVGPSGCGKSTLTRLVAGLMKPDAGEVRLHGERVTSPRRTVGMAFQNPVLLEWRTILDNVILPLEIVAPRMPRAEREARAEELLALVGLQGFETKRPSELSGGMRQRASLCRAIVHKPDVLIMDEPFGALDNFTREDLWQTMRDLRRSEPSTCVLITHDLRESVFLGDQVIVLSGRPARTQYVMDVDLPEDRTLDVLYTREVGDMLHVLRDQIKVAQGRGADDAAPPAAPPPGSAAQGVAGPGLAERAR